MVSVRHSSGSSGVPNGKPPMPRRTRNEPARPLIWMLPAAHATTKNVETCTGNALQFASLLLQDCGGKVMVFQVRVDSSSHG